MNVPDTSEFLRQAVVVPSYSALFGKEATLDDLITQIRKYPVTEWLSHLSRIQNALAADQSQAKDHIQSILGGTTSQKVQEKLKEFEQKWAKDTSLILYYERQLSTLQQLSVLNAPEHGDAKLDTEDGRHCLSIALLMTMDLLDTDRPRGESFESLIPISIQDQIRMSITSAPAYALRAFYFYQLGENAPADAITTYLKLFETAAHVDAVECLLGGLCVAIREKELALEKIAKAWHTIPRQQECTNEKEGELLGAYQSLRMKPLADLRSLIQKREDKRPPRDWNLIALSQAPLVDLGKKGAFVLNHTALGRSLFDSIRHAILTAALGKQLPAPYDNEQAIGSLYGEVFECYIHSLLELAYPDRVYRIPEVPGEQRADILIWFTDKIVLVEIKGVHFVGLHHASFMSLEQRRDELNKIGLPNAIKQLAATIGALRSGDIKAPSMPQYDWTTTPIIPLIVTEEQLPWVPGCWDSLYKALAAPLEELSNVGPLAKLRIMKIDDVERLPDLALPHDLATALRRWGDDPCLAECTWSVFLSRKGGSVLGKLMPKRFTDMMRFLAERIGLDPSKIGVFENGDESE